MPITYDYYRIFYHVARCRSFTRAAEVLENNQPNVTRCMNNLEHELGCTLFVRSNRGISLTPEGERLYRHVAVAYEQITIGEDEVRQDCALRSGTISVGASETALLLMLLKKLSAFHSHYPGVRLRITNDSSPQAVSALKNGETDCAVVTAPYHVERSLRITPLMKFQNVLLCGNDYRELTDRTHWLRDLSTYPLISLGRNTGTYEFYQRFFAKHDLPFRVDMEAATVDQVLPMIRYNLGIGFCAKQLAVPYIEAGEVHQVHLMEPIPERMICLVENPARPQSVAMKEFRRLLCEDLPEQGVL